jgi:hypothetical protein
VIASPLSPPGLHLCPADPALITPDLFSARALCLGPNVHTRSSWETKKMGQTLSEPVVEKVRECALL